MVLVYCGIERVFATKSRKNANLRISGMLANILDKESVLEEDTGLLHIIR